MSEPVTVVQAAGLVTITLGAAILGLTRKAIEGKIYRGDWLEGREYHRAPDGSIWVNVEGVQRWVTGQGSKSGATPSASRTRSQAPGYAVILCSPPAYGIALQRPLTFATLPQDLPQAVSRGTICAQSESRTPRVQKGSRHATRVFRRGKLAIRSLPLDIAQDRPGS